MMSNKDDFIKKSFDVLQQDSTLSQQQKNTMLNNILNECKDISLFCRLKHLVTLYPWRFAFGVSAIQSIALTIILGTKYTNLFVGLLGGRI